jgi:colanic acid/amylovoran biosynthesis glycosyltransferase
MKIAVVLQAFPALSETFILDQIIGLIRLKHDIKIIAFNRSKDQKQHEDVSKYDLLSRTTFINKMESKFLMRTRAAVTILLVFCCHPLSVIKLLKILLSQYRQSTYGQLFFSLYCIKECFDGIICHYGTIGEQAVILKKLGMKTKLLTVFHGYDVSAHALLDDRHPYRELFSTGDAFLPISEYWKNKLISLGCPREKITVMHMGIDTSFFKRDAKKENADNIKILTVARLVEKKGHCYALEAIKEALVVTPNLEYHIVGDGPLFTSLKHLTNTLGIEKKVFFHGVMNRNELLDFYQDSDIFMLPSITASTGDMEGIPVSLMEAMSCELAVISSCHSGISELVLDGQTGYTVCEKDVKALTDRIVRLANDPELSKAIGKRARTYVVERFDSRLLAKSMDTLLRFLDDKKIS